MDNLDIAATLEELADLLEIQGANPFRVRAYRNAVRTVQDLTRPLAAMVREGEDLTELPAIGKDMAGYIRELVETGRLGRLEQVAEEVPRALVDLTKLGGVGPKKARKLWEELGVTSMEELEEAARAGRVEALEGFGKRSAEKILRAIESYRRRTGRYLLSEADELVRPLLEHLEQAEGVVRLEVAGSYRRRKETVGDLDILALCDEAAAPAVMEHFTSYPPVARVDMAGETRGSVTLRSGLAVDLRILPRRSYGAALHYFTGSKDHNVAVRKLGVRRGLRISEYGIFRVPEGSDPERTGPEEGERVGGETEEDVFEAVGLPWIPPELREDRGEIEAAREGRLPALVEPDDIRGDLQMHSTWTDGKNTIEEMALACRERGYEYMAMTDHSQAVAMVFGLTPAKVREQWEEIDRARDRVDGIAVLRSLEVDILRDGSLDMPDDVLEGLDVVLVSVHSFMSLPGAEMTERVLRAIQHPLVDILAHPTGRLLGQREPFELDMEAVLQAAGELGVAVELNANPRRLDLSDVHALRARALGVPVVINTDAHSIQNLDLMPYGVDQARRGWLEKGDVLNTRSLRRLRAWLDRRRAK